LAPAGQAGMVQIGLAATAALKLFGTFRFFRTLCLFGPLGPFGPLST
jgi:hypothetical protein